MPSAEFEPAIPEIDRPQTYTLDRTGTAIGARTYYGNIITPNRAQFLLSVPRTTLRVLSYTGWAKSPSAPVHEGWCTVREVIKSLQVAYVASVECPWRLVPKLVTVSSGVPRGGKVGGVQLPCENPKVPQNCAKCNPIVKTVKNCRI